MSEKLILRMSSQTNNAVPWLVWSNQTNQVIVSGELDNHAELASLAQYAQGRQVTVLVNSADVRLYRHTMATKPSRQIIKALPFMLEDELAQDIDSLFFAIESTGFDKESGQHWINLAILDKSLMRHWTELWQQAGLTVKQVLPEVLCLPYEAQEGGELVSTAQVANGWLFRTGPWQGEFVEGDWLAVYIRQFQERDEADVPLDIHHYSPLPDEIRAQLVDCDGVTLNAQSPELAMLMLAQGAQASKWNLLQGEFAPKKAVSKQWMMWRPAAALFALVLFIEFVTMLASWHRADSQLAVAKQALVEQYQSAFPKEKVRVALLKRQLTRKVADATGGTQVSSGGFLTLMTRIAPVLKQYKNITSESYRYDGKRGELRLSASAPSFQQFEQFKVGLERLGLQVQQGAVSNEGERVSGSLSIKEAS